MRASKPAQVNTRGPRPLAPQAVVDLVCGPHADPRLGPAARSGTFVEYDLVETPPMFANPSPGDRLVRVEPGHERECGVMIGVMTHVVDGHPEGISRVWIGGDPSRSMGAVAEAECRRIIAAIDLAERLDVPVEWVAISAGARIAWDSGTENMDWCAAVVARLITFTQRGGQVVVVVSGINVGAQSYWNAEATMLGHHKGMLIMLPDQAMVLTGKRALALSGGGTHATDAHIGGYDEVMGPNGQAHHKAATMIDAYRMVFSHHSLCTRRRDEGAPVVASSDPLDRDITPDRYTEPEPFATVGEVLDKSTHPGRKQAFAMRSVMGAVVDRDAPVLERWTDMADARGTIVWDSRIGGSPVSVARHRGPPGQVRHRRPLALRLDAAPRGFAQGGQGDQRGVGQPPGRRTRLALRLRRQRPLDEGPPARVRRRDRPCGHQLRGPDSWSSYSVASTVAPTSCSPRRSTPT